MTLATVLRLNALSCLGFGGLFALFPAAVAGFLGSAPPLLIMVLGAALLGNGALLWLSARAGRQPRRHEVLFFCAGDLGWVAATVALIGAGVWISAPAGQAAALAVAAAVGAMGLAQWKALPAA